MQTRINNVFIAVFLLLPFLSYSQLPAKKEIIHQMRKVADWQMAQQWRTDRLPNGRLVMGPKSWEAGAFYPGILEIYRQTKDKKYLEHVKRVAKNNEYQRGPSLRNADDQAILQTYLELYEFEKDLVYLTSTKSTLDSIISNPQNGAIEYSWADLLFMGPPIWSRYAKITEDYNYLNYQDKIFWEAVDNLKNKDNSLFYRDDRFKTIKSDNNKAVFWSRGNGWVIAGLVRYLDYLPKGYPSRKKYENLLIEMAGVLKPLQQPDGFWKANLLEPELFPMGETSGTAFFCYAIAWGINKGILSKKQYLPVVEKAWKALNTAIHPDGKLGFVQGGGDRPNVSDYNKSNWYSAGGFLMAGRQVYKLK